jgi:hypothetical protein
MPPPIQLLYHSIQVAIKQILDLREGCADSLTLSRNGRKSDRSDFELAVEVTALLHDFSGSYEQRCDPLSDRQRVHDMWKICAIFIRGLGRNHNVGFWLWKHRERGG